MSDDIIAQAAAAAAAPANAAPDVREEKRQAVASQEKEDTRPYPERYAEARASEKAVAERAASEKMSPAEQRVAKANANPALWDKNHKDHDAARRELREAIAAAATPEEKEAYARAPLSEKRKTFDLADPDLPKPWLEDYNENFINWESAYLTMARDHGLEPRVVRDLRDAAIELGQAVADTGKPVSDEEVNRVLDRYGVSAAARPALVKLWRAVEGGDG